MIEKNLIVSTTGRNKLFLFLIIYFYIYLLFLFPFFPFFSFYLDYFILFLEYILFVTEYFTVLVSIPDCFWIFQIFTPSSKFYMFHDLFVITLWTLPIRESYKACKKFSQQ